MNSESQISLFALLADVDIKGNIRYNISKQIQELKMN